MRWMAPRECVVSSRTEPLLISSKAAQPLGSVGRGGCVGILTPYFPCCGTPCVMRTAPHGSYVIAQELSAKTVIEPHIHINSFHSGTAQNAVRKKQDIHEREENPGPTHCFFFVENKLAALEKSVWPSLWWCETMSMLVTRP